MSPASCSACVPMIATAIARSHMRMRAQLPMFTTSDTAPMVQKFARFAAAPKTKASAKPPQATRAPTWEALPMDRRPIPCRIGDPRGAKPFPADAARIALAAREALAVGLVARDGEREIDTERVAAAHDLGLRHSQERGFDGDLRAFHRALRRDIREPLERGEELRAAIGVSRIVHRV